MKTNGTFLKPLVDVYQDLPPCDGSKHFSKRQPLQVEIGFGLGEVLTREARNFPNKNFIGIEYHWERICRTLKSISRQAPWPDNIRILRLDARTAFEILFKKNSISHIYCFFPCPWPKKDHVRHRLFSQKFLKLLNNRLKDRGTIHIVTDFHPYHAWILEEAQSTGFDIKAEVIQSEFNTKFERKWKQEGQQHFYEISLQKKRAIVIPEWKAVKLKTYHTKSFVPDKFKFKAQKGEISVVFKDTLYDDQQKAMAVHLIVAEGHLVQHLRVGVMKDKKGWKVHSLSGQNYFPTKGIARAIELVYESVLQTGE